MSRPSKINQLEKLERMYRNGYISELEYLRLKDELLNSGTAQIPEEPSTKKKGCMGRILQVIGVFVLTFIVIAQCGIEETKPSPSSAASQSQPETSQFEHKESEFGPEELNRILCKKWTEGKKLPPAKEAIQQRAASKNMSVDDYARSIGYVYLDTLIEDVAMSVGVGMKAEVFLDKREQFPDVNREDRKMPPRCSKQNEKSNELDDLF